jgi:transposase
MMHPGFQINEVYLHRAPIDFRKSIGSLSVIVEQGLGRIPFDGSLYAFINQKRDRLKILYWHRNGFCLWYKRLEAQKFSWPAASLPDLTVSINAKEIEWLIDGFDLWAHQPHHMLDYNKVA